MHVPLKHRRPRRRLALITALAIAIAAAVAIPVIANLSGSTFEADDGNLVVDSSGDQDWANAPHFSKKIDKPTGTTDDSFGQGTKEDTAVPSVVAGSIPNNKSDLTRFYFASEHTIANKDFMYFAWERVQDPNGTTNMDIELNQSETLSSNGVTPVRTAGDVLFKYDLSNGGTNPNLGYHRWVTTGNPATVCEASNTVPCWDKLHTLGGNFEASINADSTVTDPIAPNNPRTLSLRTFGEAAINLTDSGIVPAGSCAGFASAYIKSRSSDSFTAAVKDFIAPLGVSISNCQPDKIVVQKNDARDGTAQPGAVFQLFLDDNGVSGLQTTASGGTPADTQVGPADNQSGLDCTTNSSGQCTWSGLTTPGTYIAHEKTPPTGFNTDPNGDQSQAIVYDGTADTFTLTFNDSPTPGKIVVTKKDDDDPAAIITTLPTYVLWKESNSTSGLQKTGLTPDTQLSDTCTQVLNQPGVCQFTQLDPGSYYVEETVAPPGYDLPSTTVQPATITVSSGGDTVQLTFNDPRRFTVITIVCKQAGNTLYPSSVVFDGQTKTSLGSGDLGTSGVSQSTLCNIGNVADANYGAAGARFTGKHASNTAFTGSVTIAP